MPSPQYNPRRQNREAPKKPNKRSGASPTRRDSMSVQIPWWLWIVIGTAFGVLVSFLIRYVQAPADPVANETQKVAEKNPKTVVEKKVEEKPAALDNADTKTPLIKMPLIKTLSPTKLKPSLNSIFIHCCQSAK